MADEKVKDGLSLRAWLAVLGGHLVFMNTWGVVNSFGLYQASYSRILSRSDSDISWIGSLQIFLILFGAAFSGYATDRGHFRIFFVIGTALIVAGTLASSWATQYWQVMLSQGLCVGLGNAFFFCPGFTVMTTYTKASPAKAVGLAAAGSATGGLIYPAMIRQLEGRIGFPWTVRAVALLIFVTSGMCNVLLTARKDLARPPGKLFDPVMFGKPHYTFYTAGSFMCFMGTYFPFFYLSTYTQAVRGFSYTDSLNLLMILNGVGIVGRTVPPYLSDKIGLLNIFIPVAASGGVVMLSWIAVSSDGGLYAWTVVYGLLAGAIQAMFPAGASMMADEPTKKGTVAGMTFTIVSFAVLVGPPICGAIIGATSSGSNHDGYDGGIAFAGACILLGAAFLAISRMYRTQGMKNKLRVKI